MRYVTDLLLATLWTMRDHLMSTPCIVIPQTMTMDSKTKPKAKEVLMFFFHNCHYILRSLHLFS